jgi:hypothetical protein
MFDPAWHDRILGICVAASIGALLAAYTGRLSPMAGLAVGTVASTLIVVFGGDD